MSDELASLRKQLEEEKRARLALEEEVEALRLGDASLSAEKTNEDSEVQKALEDEVKELNRKNKALMAQMEDLFRKLESEGEGHVNMLVKKIIEEKKDKEREE